MKIQYILLGTTILFAFFTVTFGYQGLLTNYQFWTCWHGCMWDTLEDCEEICKDVKPENKVEMTREERREHYQKLREVYDPIVDEYTNSVGIIGGVFGRGTGSTYPDNLEDNIEASFHYSDGVFAHFEKLEIASVFGDSENPGKITVIREMIFPEMYVFWIFTIGIGVLVGFKIKDSKRLN